MSAHSFHIPVMGTGFTVDTPLHVARYGISSVVSLGDDLLLEQMRRYHCERERLPFEPVNPRAPNARVLRTRHYLDVLDRLVARQVADLPATARAGSGPGVMRLPASKCS